MPTALDRFFMMEVQKYGDAEYFFKGDTVGSKIRAFYMRPLCPTYSDDFSTTIYPNTHFAAKKRGRMLSCLETEYHENVHKWDRWREGFRFVLKYAWPHWMALPFLIAVVIMSGFYSWMAFLALLGAVHVGLTIMEISARRSKDGKHSGGSAVPFYFLSMVAALVLIVVTVMYGKGWALLWLGAALFISPWPLKPFWRRDYEIRGYTMSMYRVWVKYRNQFDERKWRETIDKYTRIFAGPEYFFMETDKDRVRKEFLFQSGRMQFSEEGFLRNWIWSRKIGRPSSLEAEPFRMVKEFMEQEGLGG